MRLISLCAALAAWPMLALAQTETPTVTTAVEAPAEAPAAVPATPLADTAPVAAAPAAPAATTEQAPTAEQQEMLRQAQVLYDSLERRTGVISLAGGKVTLNVPETHYFVGAADARRIIVDVWGNPPTSAEGIEGIIFLANANPALGAWGALVQYSADGHVADDEARTINYTNLLQDMQRGTTEENTWRRENNYPSITLVGWAETPSYDRASHKLYWAKELAFGGDPTHALNYDIRVLGREGYLVVSFVATMQELAEIHAQAPTVMAMANFTQGNTYADYREGVDHDAAYGIGELIAGGALAAVAQKTGLLALILAFGKKFIILIGAAIAGLGGAVRRFFQKKPAPDDPS